MIRKSSEGISLDVEGGNEKFVTELTGADAPAVVEVERDAYADNPHLINTATSATARLAEMEVVRNSQPSSNLSLKYEQDGKLKGYILAFETEYTKKDDLLPLGSRYVHIADFAVRDHGTVAGARIAATLLQVFLNRYQEHYYESHSETPILFVSREHTSRRLMRRQLSEIERRLGAKFNVTEPNAFKVGNDTMYRTVLRPIFE